VEEEGIDDKRPRAFAEHAAYGSLVDSGEDGYHFSSFREGHGAGGANGQHRRTLMEVVAAFAFEKPKGRAPVPRMQRTSGWRLPEVAVPGSKF